MTDLKVFADRMKALRNSGKKAGIDAFLVVSDKNMRYLAGFSALAIERFAGIIVPVDTDNPIVIVPKLEESKARKKSAFKEIKTYSDSENPAVVLEKAVKELGLTGATFGVEGILPFRFYRMLVACSSDIKTTDASALFTELRIVKSEEELGLIEKAAEVVAEGIRAGIDFIKPGVSELTISCQIERVIKKKRWRKHTLLHSSFRLEFSPSSWRNLKQESKTEGRSANGCRGRIQRLLWRSNTDSFCWRSFGEGKGNLRCCVRGPRESHRKR